MTIRFDAETVMAAIAGKTPDGWGEVRVDCPNPECEGSQRDTLGVNIDDGAYHCFRCGARGNFKVNGTKKKSMAQFLYEKAQPVKTHPYAEKKQIQPPEIRQDVHGNWVIPFTNSRGEIQTVQFIKPDGKKFFLSRAKNNGVGFRRAAHIIEGGTDTIIWCEGIATGWSIHHATGTTVYCCGSKDNLDPVMAWSVDRYPNSKKIVAGDNDKSGDGQRVGAEAAKKHNVLFAVPGIPGTDFNDMAIDASLDAVKKVLDNAGKPDAGTENQDKPETWEPIIPLESETAPPMDPAILPGTLRDIVVEVDRATETPPELGTGMGTAVVATCCQGKMIIEPRPGYWEPLSLFTVTALDSANRKSGVTSIMTEPLRAAELEMWAKAEPFIKEMASRQKNIESRLKSLRAKYGKAKPDELREIENEIQEMERQVEPVPPLPRLWADDVTPEHLGTMMHQHNERMSILSAEGGIFDILAGRYSNGIPNMEVFLKGHACEPGRVDRGSREPVFLDAPCLTIGLAPQPAVLRGLTGKPGFRGRGLLARFLYFLPASRLGYRTLKTDPVPERVKQAWGNLISQLLSIEPRLDEHDRETPYIIKLSTEALNEWEDFSQAVEVEMRPGGRFEPIKDWAGKLPGAAARIAGLFHCIENPRAPWADPVTGETMTQALSLSAVYADHALVAFGLMGGDPALEGAKKVWRWIETGRHRQFSKRDCFQALRGTFTRAKEIEEPMSVLIERNYIRTEAVKTGGSKGGRPTEIVTVNPEILRGWA